MLTGQTSRTRSGITDRAGIRRHLRLHLQRRSVFENVTEGNGPPRPKHSSRNQRKPRCSTSRSSLDGQLITVPSIDYTKYPEGIDASTGSEISGGFTLNPRRHLANELQSGALPIKLALISVRRCPRRSANRPSARACSQA